MMSETDRRQRAWALLQRAHEAQTNGRVQQAVRRYRRSLDACPTAEAYTFLGWTYMAQGDLGQAIAMCQRAIEIDPDFGNPYNDIGAYLIEQGLLDEAIPWLEKAVQAKRYDTYCFPWVNLGRIWERKGQLERAAGCYKKALACNSTYQVAAKGLARIRGILN